MTRYSKLIIAHRQARNAAQKAEGLVHSYLIEKAQRLWNMAMRQGMLEARRFPVR